MQRTPPGAQAPGGVLFGMNFVSDGQNSLKRPLVEAAQKPNNQDDRKGNTDQPQ
jgi:hypothetical protein